MLFPQSLLDKLNSDPIVALDEAIILVRERLNPTGQQWDNDEYLALLEFFALVTEITNAGIVSLPNPGFDVGGDLGNDCSMISQYLDVVSNHCGTEAARLRYDAMKSRFKGAIGSSFSYEFTQGDLERVQELINQLRVLIIDANGFDSDHRRRLLSRLEKLQSEMHKKVSDLDRLWGLIGDAGVVLGKLGSDAKPIVDRVREIADIVWQTQSRAEELPSGTQPPLLPSNRAESGEGHDKD